jgi:Leucine-rich repeat (LRR) protein
MQAPGSGSIILEKSFLATLHSLIGLEVQGYSSMDGTISQDTLTIAADAFAPLRKLTYLSMDKVFLKKRFIDNELEDKLHRKIVRYNYTIGDDMDNDIEPPSVIILQPSKAEEESKIVPYSVYQSEPRSAPYPVQPKVSVAFTSLPNLQHLRISGCNLQDISWDMFNKLDSLKFLLLDDNDLLFLPDFVFYATSNLTALSLARNRILNLQTVGLVGLLYLQKLDVSYNNITHLSELSLPPFPHLEVADFRYNPIEAIFPNTFEVMNTTKTLLLGSPNTPIEFSPNSFYGLTALNRLDVTNVKIGFLERPMFKGMPELKSLTLTGKITRISYDAFSEVPKLEKLVLKECSILKISMDAFFGLSSLIELDLSHNELGFLPPGLFEQQTSLREIFLQHNRLTTLPPNTFAKIPAKLIRLEGNPWFCSCDMKYWDSRLINRVKRYQVNGTSCTKISKKGAMCTQNQEPSFQVKYAYEKRVSPVCDSPSKFKDRSVFEVLRKGLNYCENSLQQNISIILKATNPTETIEKMGLSPPPETDKQQEKQLLFPPKVRKPWKVESLKTLTSGPITTTTTTTTGGVPTSPPITDVVDENDMDNNIISGIPADPFPEQRTLLKPQDSRLTKFLNISSSVPTIETSVRLQRTSSTVEPVKPPIIDDDISAKPPKSDSSKLRNNKRKNQDEQTITNSNKSATPSQYDRLDLSNSMSIDYPPISKKALKLMRLQKKLLRHQQQQQQQQRG